MRAHVPARARGVVAGNPRPGPGRRARPIAGDCAARGRLIVRRIGRAEDLTDGFPKARFTMGALQRRQDRQFRPVSFDSLDDRWREGGIPPPGGPDSWSAGSGRAKRGEKLGFAWMNGLSEVVETEGARPTGRPATCAGHRGAASASA